MENVMKDILIYCHLYIDIHVANICTPAERERIIITYDVSFLDTTLGTS